MIKLTIIPTLLLASSLSTASVVQELETQNQYRVSGQSKKHHVACELQINRRDEGRNGIYHSSLSTHFVTPRGHRGSASSTAGLVYGLTDSDIHDLLSDYHPARIEKRDLLITSEFQGNNLIITIAPIDERDFFDKMNSTFVTRIQVNSVGEITRFQRKYWQKSFLGLKHLSFEDVCIIE